jgi:uncharacterized RDD family membrane protein YckC
MQQAPPQQSVLYAGLGLRFAAVVIDTAVLFAVYLLIGTIWALALVSKKNIDPQDSAAVQTLLNQQIQDVSTSTFYLVVFGSLFIYYLLLEGIFSASIGKLALGTRVVMADGSRATGIAVVLRNLVRIPEAVFLYVPSALSCTASPRRQRLGDLAAHTVVVRRQTQVTVVYGGPAAPPQYGAPPAPPSVPQAGGQVPAPAAPAAAWPAPADPPAVAAEPPAVAAEPPAVDQALVRLKTAALAARGAHLTYLRFSERELAAGGGEQAGAYSDGYVSAWFTLTEAIAALQDARARLEDAATAAGRSPQDEVAAQPDLAHVLAELQPYFAAAGDDEVHEAFLTVARAEAADS